VRLYKHEEIAAILRGGGLTIERAGTRCDWTGIVFMPLHAFNAKRFHGFVPGGVFWDLFGFAEEVFAVRPPASR
jgi:hypothetical protein